MKPCNCNYGAPVYEVCCHNGCCQENLCELDCIIANLKTELFERRQNMKNYCELESKYCQLQDDFKLLCDKKKSLELEICQVGESGNKLISDLQNENDNLKCELNEKNVLNKKLYGDNNNLYQALDGKNIDNQNLKDRICNQENVLLKLKQDKSNLENTIQNLSNLRNKYMNDISNLNDQINLLNRNSNDLNLTLRSKNCENEQVKNQFNKAKNINNDLVNVLKAKECSLIQTQKELCCANDRLAKLEKDCNYMNYTNGRNNDDINCTNSKILQETSIKKEVENNNSKLNCTINSRNSTIDRISNENNLLKMTNTNINRDNLCLTEKLEAYKKHMMILTQQNEKLSAELEGIVCRDSQLLCTLDRDSHLRALQNENKNNIHSSLDYIKTYSKFNGRLSRIGNFDKNDNDEDIKGSYRTGKFGMNLNGSNSFHNSKRNSFIDIGKNNKEEQQYSGGEEEQYSGGEEMKYSEGEEQLGQNSGEENQ